MENRIGYVLKIVQGLLRTRMDKALESRGITVPQYAALASLERRPGASNAELARLSFVTPQTMIRIIANLEELGLITREPHPTHGRILQTKLTDKGRQTLEESHQLVANVENRMLENLDEGDKKIMLELLYRCVRSLED